MVALEAVMLGLIGWGGGLLAGWGLLRAMARLRPDSISEGAELGLWCVALSGACALGGSLAASILPAWRATRVTPLEALAPRRRGDPGRPSRALAAIGLALIAVNPLVVFALPIRDAARYGASAAFGCTSMAVGFILLAPLAVVLTERLLGPALARLLGLNPRLLAAQLSSNMGRTVGTTVAMTIGLGLFVAMQTWGYSMLAPFTPGDLDPRPGRRRSRQAALPELRRRRDPPRPRDQRRPVPPRSPSSRSKFAEDVDGLPKERPSATRQDTCVLVGVDPDAALGGD